MLDRLAEPANLRRLIAALQVLVAAAVAFALIYAIWTGFESRRVIAHSARQVCSDAILDRDNNIAARVDTIGLRRVQASSAQGIASDPFQSAKTRRVRAAEAARLRESVRVLHGLIVDLRMRVDPERCIDAFPAPSLLP